LLKIRLARVGKKKQPSYRVVVADARAPRDGAYVEIIGHYNPRTEPATFELDEDKARGWLSKGAQPTERIHKLLATRGIVEARVYAPPKPKAAPQAAAQARPAATAVAEPPAATEGPAAEEPAAEPAAEEPAAEEPAAEPATAEAEEPATEQPEAEAESEETEA
jgi:small subunit ribosomal protein S16